MREGALHRIERENNRAGYLLQLEQILAEVVADGDPGGPPHG